MDRESTAALATLILLSAGVLLALAPPVRAAKRLEPPTLMMMDRYQQVAVAIAEGSPQEGKVAFRPEMQIHGETPERLVARLDAATIRELVWGNRYILAWTEIRRNPRDRDSPEIDPEGPKVVRLPVIGPALLEDTVEVRSLFAAARDRQTEPGRAFLQALLTQLARPEARTRRFVIAELYLRPTLVDQIVEDDLDGLRSATADVAIDAESRSFLLEIAGRLAAPFRGRWLAEIARQIADDAGTELDLGSTDPLLVKTALQVLAPAAEPTDAALLARHFGSNSPGVAKTALVALSLLDPKAAAARARALLAQGGLHQTTRQAMARFVEHHERGMSGASPSSPR